MPNLFFLGGILPLHEGASAPSIKNKVIMAKIKYKVDSKGVLTATADVYAGGVLTRIGVTAAALDDKEEVGRIAWGQLTFDLFSEKSKLQNGTSEPKGGK